MDTKLESYNILLLQIIKVNGSVESLMKIGYDYVQIADDIIKFRQENVIRGVGDDISLTEKGEKLLKSLNSKLNRKGLSKWISPKMDDKIETIGIFDIYLPPKKLKIR